MFRIGVMELVLTCIISLLVLAIPVAIAWLYKRIDYRLKNIEENLAKKSKE